MQKETDLAELKTRAQIAELVARVENQTTKSKWYPAAIICAAIVATVIFTKLFL